MPERLHHPCKVLGAHRQDDLPLRLAPEFVEVGIGGHRRIDRLSLDRSIRSGRPGQWKPDERLILGLDHVPGKARIGPAPAEGPRLFVDIGEAVFLEALHDPFTCCRIIGRAGQPRAVHIGEIKLVVHDLGVFERLGFDPVDHREIDRLFTVGEHRGQEGPTIPGSSLGFHKI